MPRNLSAVFYQVAAGGGRTSDQAIKSRLLLHYDWIQTHHQPNNNWHSQLIREHVLHIRGTATSGNQFLPVYFDSISKGKAGISCLVKLAGLTVLYSCKGLTKRTPKYPLLLNHFSYERARNPFGLGSCG